MKTVELKSNKTAIVIISKQFLTKDLAVKILGDSCFNNGLLFEKLTKKRAIEIIKYHLWYQGITAYSDWYEDTEHQEKINECYKLADKYVSRKFPELKDL